MSGKERKECGAQKEPQSLWQRIIAYCAVGRYAKFFHKWSTIYGGKAASASKDKGEGFRRLPIDHCSLSLQPFENPLCSTEGHIFDLMNIVPFLKKFGINPVTGKKMDAKTLIKLNFYKNAEGKYHCPVLYKVFNDHSYIVAVKTTGNVFSNEAVEELNLKSKNFKDLLTDEPFARTDIIVLQNPADLRKFNLSEFHYLRNSLRVEDEELEKEKKSATYHLKSVSVETKDILDELQRQYKPKESLLKVETRTADMFNAAHYSTGAVAAAFTSTVLEPTTTHQPEILDENVVLYARIRKKAYVRLQTNLGPLNVELHSDIVPKTCDNFIKLCHMGYYNNTIFHRSIRNFMIQGGDPTGTGKGGESVWRNSFPDEFKQNLSHTGRGIVSMANSGPNTNKSQFFITYRSCKHLDKKHTIFGRLVGGQETLNAMEYMPVDYKDKPIEDIRIEKALVFVDPFEEADEKLAKDRISEENRLNELSKASTYKTPVKTYKKGVGKYINPISTNEKKPMHQPPLKRTKTAVGGGFGDFTLW